MAPPRRIEAALDDDGCSTLSTLPCDKTLRLGRYLDVADDDSFLDAPPPPPGVKGGEEGKEERTKERAEESLPPCPASEAPRQQSLDLARRLGANGCVRGRTGGPASSRLPAPSAGGDAWSIDGGRPRRTAVDPPDGAVGPDVRYLSHSADGNGATSRQRSPSGQEGQFFSRSDGALLAASLRRSSNVGAVPLDYGGRGRSAERRQQRVHSRSEGGRTSIERWRESAGSDGAVTGSNYRYRGCADGSGRRRQPEACDRADERVEIAADDAPSWRLAAEGRGDEWATRSEDDRRRTRSSHFGRCSGQSYADGREHCRRSWDGRGAEFRNDPHQWPKEGRSSVDEFAHGGARRCLSRRSRSPDAPPVRIRLRRSRSCDGRGIESNEHGRSDGVVSRRSWKSATSTVVSRMRRFSSLPRSFGGRVEAAAHPDAEDDEDDDDGSSSFCSSSSSSSSFSSNEDDELSHESSDDDEGLDGRSAMSVADAVHYLNGRRGKMTKERFRSRFLSSLSVA